MYNLPLKILAVDGPCIRLLDWDWLGDRLLVFTDMAPVDAARYAASETILEKCPDNI